MVTLIGVAFNHGLDAPRAYTLPLRGQDGRAIAAPEWPAGPQPSLAAYVLDRLPPVATVLARFVSDSPLATIAIRATARPLPAPAIGPSLPDIAPVTIRFAADGDSGWCALPIDTASLRAGVGATTTEWTWAFSRDGGMVWTPIAQSVHRIYTVLSQPTLPWSVESPTDQNPALPMAEALEVATAWARGAREITDAAIRITAAVNGLGAGLLRYDVLVGAPHYTLLLVPGFMIDAFLDRLRGGEGAGPLVNCSDCATIVSTFANLLGADLSQSTMGVLGVGFPLNPIAAIGRRAFSRELTVFGFHEVAWTGACGVQDRVFDACLLTDADADPTRAPQRPSLPANQVFGTAGSGQYRDQLAAPGGRAQCIPQPQHRRRRPFAHQQVLPFRVLPDEDVARVAGRLTLPEDDAASREREYFIDGFRWFGDEFPGWQCVRSLSFISSPDNEPPDAARWSRVLVSWWRSSANAGRLRIDSFETPSTSDARRTLIGLTTNVQTPAVEPLPATYLGDTALTTPGGALVMFSRGNHVHAVRAIADAAVDVTADAQRLDAWLIGAGEPIGGAAAVAAPTRFGGGGAATWQRFVLRRAQAMREGAGAAIDVRPRGGHPAGAASIQRFVVSSSSARTAIASAGSPWSSS